MSRFHQAAACTSFTIALVSLPIQLVNIATTNAATPTPPPMREAVTAAAISNTRPSLKPVELGFLLTQASGNLLSSAQKAQLTRLPIPVVAPTALPANFRLVRATGEAGTYANGDDDSGYAIDYQGEKNTCLSIRTSQDGPRGLIKVKQVQTRFGLITVYTEKLRDSQSLVSFLGIKGNPMLISGGMQPDSRASGGWKPCRAVSVETYTQILRSLAVVK